MFKKKIWVVTVLSAFILAACDPVEDEGESTEDASTGGSATTEEGVEIALGAGSGGSFSEGAMTSAVGGNSLSAGGTTTVTVNIVNVGQGNELYSGVPVDVTFASACVDAGKASFSKTVVSTSTGAATTEYMAQGCVGTDTISAAFDAATAAVSINIAPADVNSIGLNGISATSIAYNSSSTDSVPNISTVTFLLLDDNGYPVEGQTVNFALSTSDANAGVSLTPTSATSTSEGLVETRVAAGLSAVNVRVTATYDPGGSDPVIQTQSQPIAVNSSPADSDSFSLSISEASVKNAFNTDGVTTSFSVQVADRHSNPVADGTVVSFWSEYGRVDPVCETSGGACTVTWTSGGVRPIDGLATVVAFTTGEDSFIDAGQKNGVFNVSGEAGLSADEVILSSAEMYYDLNYDGYTSTSFTDVGSGQTVPSDSYSDNNQNGSFDASSNKFRGSVCSIGAVAASHCAEGSIQVWDQSQIALNTITPVGVLSSTSWSAGNSYTISVTDSLSNFPPSGTTVAVEAIGDASADIEVFGTVPSVGESGKYPYVFSASVYAVETPGDFKVKVTFPDGLSVIYVITVA